MNVRFHIHGYGQFDGKHRIGPCVWPHFDLLTIHTGRIWIELLHCDRIELRREQSLLIYPHTHFEGASLAKRSKVSVLHFAMDDQEGVYGVAHPLGRLLGRSSGYEVYPASQPASLKTDIHRAITLAHHSGSLLSHSMREAILTLILGQLQSSRQSTRSEANEKSQELAQAIQWAASNLHELVTLDGMAAQAGYSTSHFRAQFSKQIGRSPGALLRENRFLEAARLLRETGIPIKEIARRVGYDDIAHFYRFFSKGAGMTPRRYRLRYQLRG